MGTKLPKFTKSNLWIYGIAAVVIVVGAVVAKKTLKALTVKARAKKYAKDLDSELSRAERANPRSYEPSEYDAMAESVHMALLSCNNETAAPQIASVVKRINNATDWVYLKNSYGVRDIKCGWFMLYSGSLPDFLAKVKNEGEPRWAHLVKMLNDYLATKGISKGV